MNRNQAPLERCGQSRALIAEGEALGMHVPDSSFVHPDDPTRDGDRPLAACSPEHLAELMKTAGARPYRDVELWAGKIARALAAHRGDGACTRSLWRPGSRRTRSSRLLAN
ncbi:hypothetical protein [Streptomyces sp. NPDC127084]|uniref:hypothetical protein n=1 Tax=Streptomyces sp. NPDC127084 TaxID=3347133 RepID=UPI00364B833F